MTVAGSSEADTLHIIREVVSSLLTCGLTETIYGLFVTSIMIPGVEDSRGQGVE
jgi:hypothetical protein